MFAHDKHGLGGGEAARALLDRQIEAMETGENRAITTGLLGGYRF